MVSAEEAGFLPASFLGGAVLLAKRVQLLVGDGEVALERVLGSFRGEFFLEFLIAKAGRILEGNVTLRKSLVRDRQDELSRLTLGIDDTVGVIPAARLQLKPDVLYDHMHGSLGGY